MDQDQFPRACAKEEFGGVKNGGVCLQVWFSCWRVPPERCIHPNFSETEPTESAAEKCLRLSVIEWHLIYGCSHLNGFRVGQLQQASSSPVYAGKITQGLERAEPKKTNTMHAITENKKVANLSDNVDCLLHLSPMCSNKIFFFLI